MIHFPTGAHRALPENWKEVYGRKPEEDANEHALTMQDRRDRKRYLTTLEKLEEQRRLRQKLLRELSGNWPRFKDYEEGRADRELSVAKSHIGALEAQVKDAKTRLAAELEAAARTERVNIQSMHAKLTTLKLEVKERESRLESLAEQEQNLKAQLDEITQRAVKDNGTVMNAHDGMRCMCRECGKFVAEIAGVKLEIERVDGSDLLGLGERQRLAMELTAVEEAEATLRAQVRRKQDKVIKAEQAAERDARKQARLEKKVEATQQRIVAMLKAQVSAQQRWEKKQKAHEEEYRKLTAEIDTLKSQIAHKEKVITSDLVQNVTEHEQLLETNKQLAGKLVSLKAREQRLSARVTGKAKMKRAVKKAAAQGRALRAAKEAAAEAEAARRAKEDEQENLWRGMVAGVEEEVSIPMDADGNVDADALLERLLQESDGLVAEGGGEDDEAEGVGVEAAPASPDVEAAGGAQAIDEAVVSNSLAAGHDGAVNGTGDGIVADEVQERGRAATSLLDQVSLAAVSTGGVRRSSAHRSTEGEGQEVESDAVGSAGRPTQDRDAVDDGDSVPGRPRSSEAVEVLLALSSA